MLVAHGRSVVFYIMCMNEEFSGRYLATSRIILWLDLTTDNSMWCLGIIYNLLLSLRERENILSATLRHSLSRATSRELSLEERRGTRTTRGIALFCREWLLNSIVVVGSEFRIAWTNQRKGTVTV
jgi:hypothetical protein